MLPYFHASGHLAKCAHLYLQDILNLKQTLPFLCGTWTDMNIEEYLMKNMKLQGGLTQGRGVGEGVLARWTMGITCVQLVSEQIENYCGVQFHFSEERVGLKDSTVVLDTKDDTKMHEWLLQNFLFPENPDLYSISTGVLTDGIE
ncbi:hypothetical protein PR048_030319 [Dryococelus australis]|uniref:Uncharacterized protein n=1 Tax=Dryococelus australis TaxID=614101 RepID=A0ABQ9G8M3_9NEOP|nr:hypothetical protein PR048_030319 [Dryococelus australis]